MGEQADPWPATNAARHGSREQEVRRVRDEAAQHSAPGARSASYLQGEENDLDLEIIDSRPINRMETAPLLVKGGEDWGCEALGNKTARQVRNVLLRYKDEFLPEKASTSVRSFKFTVEQGGVQQGVRINALNSASFEGAWTSVIQRLESLNANHGAFRIVVEFQF